MSMTRLRCARYCGSYFFLSADSGGWFFGFKEPVTWLALVDAAWLFAGALYTNSLVHTKMQSQTKCSS